MGADPVQDRAYRIGQQNNVTVKYQLFVDTISMKIWWTLRKKKDIIGTSDLATTLFNYALEKVNAEYIVIRGLRRLHSSDIKSVKDYIENTWPDQFCTINPEEAVTGGLFGAGPIHPEIYNRLGDLIVAAKGHAYWWWANKPNPLIGRHGGLSAEEMLVPFLAGRL